MTIFVFGNDLQTCSNRESQQRDERISKTNSVYVVRTCPSDHLACHPICLKEAVKDGGLDDLGRSGLRRSVRPRPNGRSDVVMDEPARDSAEDHFLNRRWLLALQGI